MEEAEEKKSNAGRPTDYKEDYPEQAYKLCLLGATDKDLASFFGCTETTINNWKNDHDEFFESIVNGKVKADAEVASSLFKTTQDRTVIEQVPFKTKNVFYNEDGKRIEEEKIEIVEVEKVIPADFRSQSFWLRNRKSDSWRDRQEHDLTTAGQPISIISLGSGVNPNEK